MRNHTAMLGSLLGLLICAGLHAQSKPVTADAAARDALLEALLTQERCWYDAMSLRDENFAQRPERFAQLRAGLAKDFRAITGWDEVLDGDQFVSIRASLRLNRYQLSDPQLVRLTDDTAILTYKIEEEVANQGGYKAASRVSTTWKQQDGKWLAAFCQSTSVANAGPYKRP